MEPSNELTRFDWQLPTAAQPIHLPQSEVHIWRASVQRFSGRIATLAGTLSRDELDRADRYHFEGDRQRFLIGRGLLRHLVNRYVEIPPANVNIAYGPFGKPSIGKGCPLQFNLAHSEDLIVYAFTYRRQLGIDVEKINPSVDALDLAATFCTAPELQALSLLSNEARQQTFFRLWVRKEAFLKASGEGFFGSPFDFNVSDPLLTDESPWRFHDLDVSPDYAAAVVIEGSEVVLRGWTADELRLS
jgi:4'-phosphopantetheinyl transferase